MTEKRTVEDKEFYKQACEYFYYHAEQRTTMINYFIAVFAACIALYGILLQQYTLASIVIAIFSGVVSFLFHMIDIRNRFDVKMSQHVIAQIEHENGVDIPNGKYAKGVFSNEDATFVYYSVGRRNQKGYCELKKAYRKAARRHAISQELEQKIQAYAEQDGTVSAQVLKDSFQKAPIVRLTTCIQWLYRVCMIISVLGVVFAAVLYGATI